MNKMKETNKEEKIKVALKGAQENLFIIQAEFGGAKNMALGGEKIQKLEPKDIPFQEVAPRFE